MDNKKIGELISKLRKEKGLTQQELGDKVGVGSRAVSKWECGITIPDISIINELSEILGISSHELLSGKLYTENKTETKIKTNTKFKTTIKVTVILLFILAITTISLLIYSNTKPQVYYLNAIEYDKYSVDGYISYKNNEATLHINKFAFNEDKLLSIDIKNYQYEILLGERHILGYGLKEEDIEAHTIYKVQDVEKAIKNKCSVTVEMSKEELQTQNVYVKIIIIDINDNVYHHDVKLAIFKTKNK